MRLFGRVRASARRRRVSHLADEFNQVVASRFTGDRFELFAKLRADAPMFFSAGLQAWVVSRHADVQHVLYDEWFGRTTEGPGMSILQGGFEAWSGHEHSRKMGLVARRIRKPRAVAQDVGGRA